MAAGLHAGCSYHGVWVQTEEACTSEWALDLLPREPAVTAIAEQLRGVGSMVVPAGHLPEDPALGPHTTGQGTRGIYCTLPRIGAAAEPVASPWPASSPFPCEAGAGSLDGAPRGGHFDHLWSTASSAAESHDAACLKVSGYIDDVPQGSGGFTVWPGSHRRNWASSCRGEGEPLSNAELAAQVMTDTAPVECYGPRGTVVFWHYMLLHGAGLNTQPGVVRQSIIYDYNLTAEAKMEWLAAKQKWEAMGCTGAGGGGRDNEATTLWAGWQHAGRGGRPAPRL